MAGIKGKNTKPELLIRSALHRRGYRFCLHDPRLPGKPDIVLPKWRTAIFVNGCFWHGHECAAFRWPKTRAEFWRAKIGVNRSRDLSHLANLNETGWRVLVIWECAMKGKNFASMDNLIDQVELWLQSDFQYGMIEGV